MLKLTTRIENYWKSLDCRVTVNKREIFLGAVACALAGVVTGMLISPNKQVSMGSHNKYVTAPEAPDEEDED